MVFEAAFAPVFVGGRATFCFVLVPLWKGVTTRTSIEQSQSIVIGNFEVRRIDTKELSFASCGRAIAAIKWNEAFWGRVKLLLVGCMCCYLMSWKWDDVCRSNGR